MASQWFKSGFTSYYDVITKRIREICLIEQRFSWYTPQLLRSPNFTAIEWRKMWERYFEFQFKGKIGNILSLESTASYFTIIPLAYLIIKWINRINCASKHDEIIPNSIKGMDYLLMGWVNMGLIRTPQKHGKQLLRTRLNRQKNINSTQLDTYA